MQFRGQIVIAVALLVSACSTHHSPNQQQAGGSFLFVTDDEAGIADLVIAAFWELRPGHAIRDLKGPVRGYWSRKNWALDFWTTAARIHPATGVTESGKAISGYYPEVSGRGSLIIRGPAFDDNFYELLMRKLEAFAPKEKVKSLRKGSYRLTSEQWSRARSGPPKSDGTATAEGGAPARANGSIEDRLKELEDLRTSKRITDLFKFF